MDGYPNQKSKKYKGRDYSETRFAVIEWLEKELPNISGDIINISAGGWDIPYSLLDKSKITSYATFDLAKYGDSKNKVNFYGDVHSMPLEWTNKWDCIINNQALECYENPFKAMDEMFRILKPNGVLLLDTPFNYSAFGFGTTPESMKKKNPVQDYWRITEQGLRLLAKKFSQVTVSGFGGNGNWDRYVYCLKAIK